MRWKTLGFSYVCLRSVYTADKHDCKHITQAIREVNFIPFSPKCHLQSASNERRNVLFGNKNNLLKQHLYWIMLCHMLFFPPLSIIQFHVFCIIPLSKCMSCKYDDENKLIKKSFHANRIKMHYHRHEEMNGHWGTPSWIAFPLVRVIIVVTCEIIQLILSFINVNICCT